MDDAFRDWKITRKVDEQGILHLTTRTNEPGRGLGPPARPLDDGRGYTGRIQEKKYFGHLGFFMFMAGKFRLLLFFSLFAPCLYFLSFTVLFTDFGW